MQIRRPVVAGQFYPGQRDVCVEEIEACLKAHTITVSLPDTIVGAIVPHAGWTFSGALAAMVFSAVKQQHPEVLTFVIFGAAHGYYGDKPIIDDSDFWETPLGKVGLDEMVADYLLANKLVVRNSLAHKGEHSIEVQVPFVQYLFPDERVQILPIIVPSDEQAVVLGEELGKMELHGDKKIVYIGSTDLTHYGPRYGFTPMGTGVDALEWASKVNDKKFIDLALKLDAQGLLASAAENYNACGPGAAAAAVSVARKLGKKKGLLLAYTSSNEVMRQTMGTMSRDSVGYAAIAF